MVSEAHGVLTCEGHLQVWEVVLQTQGSPHVHGRQSYSISYSSKCGVCVCVCVCLFVAAVIIYPL